MCFAGVGDKTFDPRRRRRHADRPPARLTERPPVCVGTDAARPGGRAAAVDWVEIVVATSRSREFPRELVYRRACIRDSTARDD